jgi:ABC-type antimicrobial peptide transport system permease subunit
MDSIPEDRYFTVVGVVRTIKHNTLTAPTAEHAGAYYFTYRQGSPATQFVVVRTATDPGAATSLVRDVVRRLDSELPFFGTQTMQARIDESLAQRRIPLVLLGVFALVALFLAVIGIYGALAYSVTQRRREIGIRMAMGSAPRDIFRSVVGQGMRVTVTGLALGGVATLLMTRLVQSLLFGIGATDVRVMTAVAVVLGVVGLVACMVPARRATRVDPMSVLGS